jgi:hypothetical protein
MQENYTPYKKDPTKIFVDGELIPRIVVCAANKFNHKGKEIVVCGARHWDSIMSSVVDAIGIDDKKDHEQGFIDQYQNFITRYEATDIAIANKQTMRDPLSPGDMGFSENFY